MNFLLCLILSDRAKGTTMQLLTLNQISQISGGYIERHYDSSFISLNPGECYVSNTLGANLCHHGLYDLNDNLIHAIENDNFLLNNYEVQIAIYPNKHIFHISPNISR